MVASSSSRLRHHDTQGQRSLQRGHPYDFEDGPTRKMAAFEKKTFVGRLEACLFLQSQQTIFRTLSGYFAHGMVGRSVVNLFAVLQTSEWSVLCHISMQDAMSTVFTVHSQLRMNMRVADVKKYTLNAL